MRNSFLALVLLAYSSLLIAQQSLNNDSVIKLTKAGLSDDLIVSTINASPGIYDTSADGLIALKKAGASDKVVSALVLKASSSTPARGTQSAPLWGGEPVAPVPAAHLLSTAPDHAANKPRVYLSSSSKGSQWNAARDQSMEMSKDFENECPGIRVTINQSVADYSVLLNHIEHGFARDNQIQIANKDGDLISKTKEGGSINGGVKKACAVILADWAKNNQ
jgi:hypothetical protein